MERGAWSVERAAWSAERRDCCLGENTILAPHKFFPTPKDMAAFKRHFTPPKRHFATAKAFWNLPPRLGQCLAPSAPGGPRRPQEAPGGPRRPQGFLPPRLGQCLAPSAPGSPRRPQEPQLGGPRGFQEAPGRSRRLPRCLQIYISFF